VMAKDAEFIAHRAGAQARNAPAYGDAFGNVTEA
jgi:hypothetical protein